MMIYSHEFKNNWKMCQQCLVSKFGFPGVFLEEDNHVFDDLSYGPQRNDNNLTPNEIVCEIPGAIAFCIVDHTKEKPNVV